MLSDLSSSRLENQSLLKVVHISRHINITVSLVLNILVDNSFIRHVHIADHFNWFLGDVLFVVVDHILNRDFNYAFNRAFNDSFGVNILLDAVLHGAFDDNIVRHFFNHFSDYGFFNNDFHVLVVDHVIV